MLTVLTQRKQPHSPGCRCKKRFHDQGRNFVGIAAVVDRSPGIVSRPCRSKVMPLAWLEVSPQSSAPVRF